MISRVIGILVAALLLMSVSAFSDSDDAPDALAKPAGARTESQHIDDPDGEYAKIYGVDIETSKARGAEREQFNSVVESLHARFGEAAVDAWIETSDGAQTFHVRTKNPRIVDELDADSRQYFAVEYEPADWMIQDRILYIDAELDNWLRAVPDIDGVDADIATGHIVFDVKEPTTVAEARKNLEPLVNVAFRVNSSGDGASDDNRGGLNLTSCTTGFTATYSGYSGFLTAAHCTGTQNWFAPGSSTAQSSVYRTRRWGSTADIQFRSISVSTFAQAWTGASYANITSVGTTPLVGDTYCGRGRASGFRCGGVLSTTYRSTWSNACNGNTCSSVFLRIDTSSTGGDSGGPWYMGLPSGNRAFGIHKGSASGDSIASRVGNRPTGTTIRTM